MKTRIILSVFALAFVCLFAGNAMAQVTGNIALIESQPTGTANCTINSSPVITYVLSTPSQVLNGYTYSASKSAFLAQDSSGSIDVFGALPGGYVPVAGNAIAVTGTNSPYSGVPELGTVTAISTLSTGNSVPGPVTDTIANLMGPTIPAGDAGYLVTINDVTISGMTGTFGISNKTGSISDGTNSMAFYYYPTQYSTANQNLFGQTIPTTPVNVTGIVQTYNQAGEFIPMSISPVPEPASVVLLSLATLIGLISFRFRQRS